MRLFYTLLLISSGFIACQPSESESITPDTITGAWVEASARKDTLIFNPMSNGSVLEKTLVVNRGKEVNSGGFLLPKIGSGIYLYDLQENTIVVLNLLSSSSKRTGYAIEKKGDKLYVENFFELGFNQPATATRTFVRL